MLDISPGLLVFVAIIFIFLIYALNKILYKPLLTFMSERDRSIQSDMETAKKNSGNVSHLEKEAAKIVKDAKAEAFAIREKVISEMKQKVNEAVESKKATLEKDYDQFMSELEAEKEELKNRLSEGLPLFQKSLQTKLSQI